MIDHSSWMKKALIQAEKAFESKEIPIGAIVVQNDKIIGRGYNQREQLNDPTAHAEIIAITAAANTIGDWRLNKCILYVTKEPCPMCAGAILNSRIRGIVYGLADEKWGSCGSYYDICRDNKKNNFPIIIGGILEDDAKFLMEEFFSKVRKRTYYIT